MNPEDGYCPESDDDLHCECWWDGAWCCYCGSDDGKVDP